MKMLRLYRRNVGILFFMLLFSSMFVFGVVDFTLLDFSGSAYASNGEGFTSFSACMMNPTLIQCTRNGLYDLKSVWVDQDLDYIGWKIQGNFTNASICQSGGLPLVIEIAVDSDGNISSGCMGQCHMGQDFRIRFNTSGLVELASWNSTSSQFSPDVIYNSSKNIVTGSNFTCNLATGDIVKIAVNRTIIRLKTLSFEVISVNTTAAQHDLYDALGKSGEQLYMPQNTSGMIPGGHSGEMFMFQQFGCIVYDNNQAGCQNTSDALSCSWDSNFNKCFDNLYDTNTYGCNKYCGACNNQANCTSNPVCQYISGPNVCIDDPTKFRFGGNCDGSCFDCWTEQSCNASVTAGGCTWSKDPFTSQQFCIDKNSAPKACGPSNAVESNASCYACNTQASCNASVPNCLWDTSAFFCRDNSTNAEVCFNYIDDNADGKIDCADNKCQSDKYCGGDLDNKLLTDQGLANSFTQKGICTEVNGVLQCDKEKAVMFQYLADMKPGPPSILKVDPINDTSVSNVTSSNYLDIIGFGFKDMGTAIGMGLMLRNASNIGRCSNREKELNRSVVFYYYVDIDNNAINGCSVALNYSGALSNHSGFEYKFIYNITLAYNGSEYNGSAYTERRQALRCVQDNGTTFGLYQGQVMIPSDPFNPQFSPLCGDGAAVIMVPFKDMGNPKGVMRFLGTVIDGGNASATYNTEMNVSDLIVNATYYPGQVDFKPPNCKDNPFSCGAAFATIGKGKFHPFEECSVSTGDEDQDGSTNCGDTDCLQAPWCDSNRTTLLANDKTPPTILENPEVYDNYALLHQYHNEPSNLTVYFYNTSRCVELNLSINWTIQERFSKDNYKPWHDIEFHQNTLGFSLQSNTTYFYKTRAQDVSGNKRDTQCLNFTTAYQGNKSLKWAIDFVKPVNDTLVRNLTIEYYNGSQYIIMNASTIIETNFINNGTIRFRNENASVNNVAEPWSIEFKGANIAKAATTFNITNQVKVVNDSAGDVFVGFNNTAFLEFAQKLGVDSIILNISEPGNTLMKCDESGKNCRDITAEAILLTTTPTHTVWEVPVTGAGGFSTYGVTNTGVNISSDKNVYKCFNNCTVYFNVSNTNESFVSTYNLTVINRVVGLGTGSDGAGVIFNISYMNLTTQQWIVISNTSNSSADITNYQFIMFNSTRPNETTHQFKIDAKMTYPVGLIWYLNLSLVNGTISRNFSDNVFLDAINLSTPADGDTISSKTANFTFTLFSYNDTTQSCNVNIDAVASGGNLSVFAGNTTTIFPSNKTLSNGTHYWNISCSVDNAETGFSVSRQFYVTDNSPPTITKISSSSSGTTTVTITLSVTTDENSSCGYATSNTSYEAMTRLTANASATGHTIGIDYTSDTSGTYFSKCNDTFGNIMNSSNSTAFNADVTASSSSSSSSGGGGGGGGGTTQATNVVASTSKTWTSLSAGDTAKVEVKDPNIGITNIDIAMKNSVTSTSTLEVAKLKDKPSDIKDSASSNVYQYLKLTPTKVTDTDITSVTIKFKVSKEWLASNNIKQDNVVLYRYNAGWAELVTSAVGSTDKDVLYEAITPGFSVFAIGEKKQVVSRITGEAVKDVENVTMLPEEPISEEVRTESSEDVEVKSPVEKKSKFGLVIGVVIVLLVIAGGVFFWMKRRNQ